MLLDGEVREPDAVHETVASMNGHEHHLYSWRISISLMDMRHIIVLRRPLQMLNQ
jgi:hypothetical protein